MFKTGQTAPASGRYKFARYTSEPPWPLPTADERTIELTTGEVFPPIRSVNRGAWWTRA